MYYYIIRYWFKILGAVTDHNLTQRFLESKLSESCNVAKSYFMFKDQKAEGDI